jgi:sn-glycerol 3-phosphate transport system ATP-binding protein
VADISIRRLEKRYGRTEVMAGLDLEIRSGEFVVILGPSGCGKSTLLRMIAGLESISGGEIAIDGDVVNTLEPRERGCAMVFQNYALYPHMSVAENIGYALKVAGVPKPERRRQVEAIAAATELGPYLERRPGQLSGGQRQRVAMARAMIRKPRVFLFDEPLSNLDALLRVQMRAEIRKLHRDLGTTSVFVTHDQAEAMTLADRLVLMRAGKIEQVGTPKEIYGKPANLFAAGFIGSPPMNLIRGTIGEDGDFHPLAAPDTLWPLGRRQKAGTACTLGVRPEALRFDGTGPGTATLDFVEELGASRVLHLSGFGQTLLATTTRSDWELGSRLAFTIAPEDIHVFDEAPGSVPVHG